MPAIASPNDKKNIYDFVIFSDPSPDELSKKINAKLREKYMLYGFTYSKGLEHCQALVKYYDEKPKKPATAKPKKIDDADGPKVIYKKPKINRERV